MKEGNKTERKKKKMLRGNKNKLLNKKQNEGTPRKGKDGGIRRTCNNRERRQDKINRINIEEGKKGRRKKDAIEWWRRENKNK